MAPWWEGPERRRHGGHAYKALDGCAHRYAAVSSLRYSDPGTSYAEGDSVPTTLRQLDGSTVTTSCFHRSLPAYSTLLTEAGFPKPAVDLPIDPAESHIAPRVVVTTSSRQRVTGDRGPAAIRPRAQPDDDAPKSASTPGSCILGRPRAKPAPSGGGHIALWLEYEAPTRQPWHAHASLPASRSRALPHLRLPAGRPLITPHHTQD